MSLRNAVEAGDVLRVRALLRDGASANESVENGRTVLTWAVGFAGIPVIRALVDGDGDVAAKDANGDDALERAVAAKRRNVINLLALSFSAKRISEAVGRLPYFHQATTKPAPKKKQKFEHPFVKLSARQQLAAKATAEERSLVAAATKGDVKTVRRLLEAGINPEASAPATLGPATPLWAAVEHRRTAVIRLLADAGVDLDDALPEPPLFMAAEQGQAETVRALAEGGADLNGANSRGKTLLYAAIDHGRPKVVTELLRLGADPNLRSTENFSKRDAGLSPLQVAAMKDDWQSFVAIEVAGGTDPNLNALRLCTAAAAGDLTEVKRLVEAGINVNERDSLERLPLTSAAMQGKMEVARYLLDHGANVNSTNGKRWRGMTPLGAAATVAEHVKLVQMLVEAGAKLDAKAVEGMTALEYAKRAHLKEVAACLKDVQVSRGRPAKLPGTKLRGVMSFDTNDAWLLVEADVEDVANHLKKHLGATIWKKNALGTSATITERCYAVLQLVGVPWTVVARVNCPINQYLKPADAQALSKSLKKRAINLANSDTGGVTQYALYDKGKLQEFFGHSSMWEDADKASLKQHFGVDLADFDDVEQTERNVFVSRLRKVKLSTIKNDLDFVNDFVKGQNALVPDFVGLEGNAGNETEFEFDFFADDEIERLDYVAVATPARTKKVR